MKFAPNPIVAKNMANFHNTVTGLLFTVFRSSICVYYVSNSLESLPKNFYLTKLRLKRWPVRKILSQDSESSFTATPIVLTIKTTQLPRDCHLTLLRPRRLQISKILSHASELSLLSSYLVLSIIVTFWSFYGEILAEPYYCPKDNQFQKHCQMPHNNLS